MSGADALRRNSKGSVMVRAYLDLLAERECRCGYYESARRHHDPADPDYHVLDEVTPEPNPTGRDAVVY